MKNLITAAALAVTLTITASTALAHERCRDDDRSYYYRNDYRGDYRHVEVVRYQEPEVYFDRYGNRVIVRSEQRYAAPVAEPCHRPVVVVPECHRAPVCEQRYETRGHFEPPLIGVLKSLFHR